MVVVRLSNSGAVGTALPPSAKHALFNFHLFSSQNRPRPRLVPDHLFYMGEPTIRIFRLLPHTVTCQKQYFSQGSGLVKLLETSGNHVRAYLIG